MVDAPEGIIAIEWIHGQSVRFLLPGGGDGSDDELDDEEEVDLLVEYGIQKGITKSHY